MPLDTVFVRGYTARIPDLHIEEQDDQKRTELLMRELYAGREGAEETQSEIVYVRGYRIEMR